jgi:hypothetical protein
VTRRVLLTDETVRRAWRETTTINRMPAAEPANPVDDHQNDGLIRQLAAALFGERRSDKPEPADDSV